MREKVDILIERCTILPMNGRLIEEGNIAIKDGVIQHIGKEERFYADIRIDGRKFIAMPGLVNAHTHASMTIFRGLGEDMKLEQWLENVMWPLESKLKVEDVYAGAILACAEMIKSGTTCFADMYHLEEGVVKAVEESGMRAVLSQGFIGTKEGLKESCKFALKYNGYVGRIYTMLSPHSVYTCDPELLSEVKEEADKLKLGVHIHLAESKQMSKAIKDRYGRSEVQLLEDLGLLSNKLLAAHCIYLSDEDVRLLAERKVNIAHNPVSNMKLGLGIARIREFIERGINVGIGTDGPASNNDLDMFDDIRLAALLQKSLYEDPRAVKAEEVLRMATLGGAKALLIDHLVGSLEEGKKADLILINKRSVAMTPLHNIYASIVYSAKGSDVDTVIIDGKIVMQNRKLLTLDEEKAIEMAEKSSFNLLER